MSVEYVCEVSGRRYKTARGARKSAKRERLREYQRNYVRLNAGTTQEFLDLMVEKSKEFYGWDMELKIKKSGFDHWQSIEENIEDKVLLVEAYMRLSINRRKGRNEVMYYFIPKYFKDVHPSCFWREVKDYSMQSKKIEFRLTLGCFPKLLENYKKFLEQQSEYFKFIEKKRKASSDARQFVESRPDYRKLLEHRKRIEGMLRSHEVKMKKMFDYYEDGYIRLWECSNGEVPEIDFDLRDTFD